MSPQAKWEYMKAIYDRYHKANGRKEKGAILGEFCKSYRCHRKSALRLMNGPRPGEKRPSRGHKKAKYVGRVLDVLEAVWEATGYLWSERLKAAIPLWLPWIRQRYHLTPKEDHLLQTMSPATMNRKLKAKKLGMRKRLYGTTKPGALLKHHIPIEVNRWDTGKPGFGEVDLVAHCGDCAEGDFANTLDYTDLNTTWVERRCVLGKSQVVVCAAIDEIRQELPFDLQGLHADNGSEFINYHLLAYCQADPKVQLSRGRPCKKDDNAHFEQKNWTHVRKLIGYGRYDTPAAVAAINDLYRNELRLLQNLFQPSVKLARKVRVGSKIRRVYDAPKAPLDRVLACGKAIASKAEALRILRDQTDPFELSAMVDRKLAKIWAMVSKAPRPSWHRPGLIANYRRKPVEGPPHMPVPWPALERYEGLLAREQALKTW